MSETNENFITISPNDLIEFFNDLSIILDSVIVNEKQRKAISYQILKLRNIYFLDKLPED